MRLIPVLTYIKNLIKIYLFAEDITNLLKISGIRSILIKQKLSILDEVLKEYKIIPEKTPSPLQEITEELQKKIEEMVKEQRERVEEFYPLTIINQSLSIMCSFLESFLIESLNIIFDKDNRTLIKLSQQKEMKLDDIIKLKTFDEVISSFKKKTLICFSRDSIEDKFIKYYQTIGFDISKFFDMSRYTEEVQTKFKGWDLKKLDSIFIERHKIVHDQQYSLVSLEDLHDRKKFFEKIIVNMTLEITNKFDIPNELKVRTEKKKSESA